ncbi:hypothetical protein Nepgr_028280 [Nepenthes gracilis]|uniref:Uncharacterized protein n=1 Tax=Nepenthes gracilis TaxID=150966 RepID=A0AAD3TBN6_NEPGR|nr:hypothetical protein Nepgr_028280 [Nepenthes gracilis]
MNLRESCGPSNFQTTTNAEQWEDVESSDCLPYFSDRMTDKKITDCYNESDAHAVLAAYQRAGDFAVPR